MSAELQTAVTVKESLQVARLEPVPLMDDFSFESNLSDFTFVQISAADADAAPAT